MTSKEKTKLIELGNEMNSGDLDINKRLRFCEYVLEKIDTFDIPIWDIYINIEDVININEDPRLISYYKKILELIGIEEPTFSCSIPTLLKFDLFREHILCYLNKLNNIETNGN